MGWAVLDEVEFGVAASDGSVAVDVFERVGRVAARCDVGLFSDDELLAAVGASERTRRQLDATANHLLAELESRGLTVDRRGLRTGQWVAFETHESIPATQRRVTVARRVRDELPAVDQALTAGRIGSDHVEVLCRAAHPRILDRFGAKLPWLIGLAEELPFEPWKRHVHQLAQRLDFDGGYRPEDDPEASKLFFNQAGTGDIRFLSGVFVGPSGVVTEQILNERADQLWRRFRRDNTTSNGAIKIPRRPSLLAMALEELLVEARAADPTTSKAPVTDLTVVLRWNVSDLFPDGLTPNGAMSGGASLATLFDAGRYQNRRIPDVYETFDGCTLSEPTMGDRLCDPAISFLLTDNDGSPLNLGRTVRFASDEQRKTAKIRDGGCTFPGCDRPGNWCDCHHVVPVADGGNTNIEHLACLCRFHHGITHRTGWHMFTTNDGWFWWQTPHGDTFWSQRNHQQRAGPPPPPI